METLQVATFLEALALVGQVYRNKDGSQPAEAVKKILQQFDGAAGMTLAEWAEAKQSTKPKHSKPESAPKRSAKPKLEKLTPDEALTRLQRAETQAALRNTLASLALSAAEWQIVAKKLTGRAGKPGKAAREAIETYLSDRLLLDERVESVRRSFG